MKRLHFRGPEIPVLSSLLLKRSQSASLPPWPDLVLCAEASPSVIARDIKRQVRRPHAHRLRGPARRLRQRFRPRHHHRTISHPASPNVVELSMPLAAAAEDPAAARPRAGPCALLVGGPAFPDRLDAAAAAKLATDAIAYAARRNSHPQRADQPAHARQRPSPRWNVSSPRPIASRLRQGENRYKATLAEASEIVVTSDSVSMVSDALASGKPVSDLSASAIAEPEMAGRRVALPQCRGRALAPPFAPARWLFDIGLIEAAADRRRLFTRLVAEKRLGWFGDEPVPPQPQAMRGILRRRSSLCVH